RRVAAARALPVGDRAVTIRVTAVRRVLGAETADGARLDCACRDLIGRVPLAGIRETGERESVDCVALAVAQHAVQLPVVVGMHPWPVVVFELEGCDDVAGAEFR